MARQIIATSNTLTDAVVQVQAAEALSGEIANIGNDLGQTPVAAPAKIMAGTNNLATQTTSREAAQILRIHARWTPIWIQISSCGSGVGEGKER
jgi:hypothetical protein